MATDSDKILAGIRDAEDRIAIIEDELTELRSKLASMDSNGNGVRVIYDYDLLWVVDEMRDGEWEVDGSFTNFSAAVEHATGLAEAAGVGLEINSYLPPRKYRKQAGAATV